MVIWIPFISALKRVRKGHDMALLITCFKRDRLCLWNRIWLSLAHVRKEQDMAQSGTYEKGTEYSSVCMAHVTDMRKEQDMSQSGTCDKGAAYSSLRHTLGRDRMWLCLARGK
jgi:hypothetical protein